MRPWGDSLVRPWDDWPMRPWGHSLVRPRDDWPLRHWGDWLAPAVLLLALGLVSRRALFRLPCASLPTLVHPQGGAQKPKTMLTLHEPALVAFLAVFS